MTRRTWGALVLAALVGLAVGALLGLELSMRLSGQRCTIRWDYP